MKEKRENKVFKVFKYVIYSILVIVLLINFTIIIKSKTSKDKVPSVFGYKPFIVLSGSMQPNIKIGDLVFVKSSKVENLNVNDIVAFKTNDNTVTTHRIIAIDTTTKGERCFITKGDSNNVKDEELVCKNNLEGKMVKRIPKLGKFINFIQQPLGFLIMMMTIFIICLFIYLYEDKKINKKYGKMTKEDLKAFEEFKKSQGNK